MDCMQEVRKKEGLLCNDGWLRENIGRETGLFYFVFNVYLGEVRVDFEF